MAEIFVQDKIKTKEQIIIELTSLMLHKHYCEKDVESLTALIDDSLHWIGTGEEEYAADRKNAAELFLRFTAKLPKCSISDEKYHAMQLSPDTYLCTGRLWISAVLSGNDCLRVHQRITTVFRWKEEGARCCHIHISNPSMKMTEEELRFSEDRDRQTSEYLQRCIETQKKQLKEQTSELAGIYNSIPCGIIRLLKDNNGYRLLNFNRTLSGIMKRTMKEIQEMDWSKGFCESVAEEDKRRIKESLDTLQRPGDSCHVDYKAMDALGQIQYLNGDNMVISRTEQGLVIQRIIVDITERIELEKKLIRMSFEDSLTGLYNRNKFNHDALFYQNGEKKKMGIVCLDINGLKIVNDMMGHLAGDDLICQTANYLRRFFHGNVYRIGGDEFVVVEEKLGKEVLEELAFSLKKALEQEGIHISIGLSWRDSFCSFRELLEEADRHMYQDKKKFYGQGEQVYKKQGYTPGSPE